MVKGFVEEISFSLKLKSKRFSEHVRLVIIPTVYPQCRFFRVFSGYCSAWASARWFRVVDVLRISLISLELSSFALPRPMLEPPNFEPIGRLCCPVNLRVPRLLLTLMNVEFT